ncbi:MAG: hypothetical protein ACKOFD_08110 [Actinomycetota bacterium]
MNETPSPPPPPTSDGPTDLATQRAISAALSHMPAADEVTKNAHISAALQAFDDMPVADRAAVASGRNWLASAAAAVVLAATAAVAGYLVNGNANSDTTVAAENDTAPTRNTAKNPCADVMSGAQFLNSTTVDGKQVHLYLRTDAGKVEVVLLNAETCAEENAYVLALSGG